MRHDRKGRQGIRDQAFDISAPWRMFLITREDMEEVVGETNRVSLCSRGCPALSVSALNSQR